GAAETAVRRQRGGRTRTFEGISTRYSAARGLLPVASDVPRRERRASDGTGPRGSDGSGRQCCQRWGAGGGSVIVCRSAAELEKMRAAGRLVGEVLTALTPSVVPGVTTAELDEVAEKMITDAGAIPAFKGYHGYPATICSSINEEVIHGIPSGQ